jgi:hypothetical protein
MKYEIMQEEFPINPRESFDHLGTMICGHPNYNLGDYQVHAADLARSFWVNLGELFELSAGQVGPSGFLL